MARLLLASLLLLASASFHHAHAQDLVRFTPESGWWWNPAEDGVGFSIEIQDDFIFMVAFAYEDGGFPTWYAAQGTMTDNAFFTAPLYQRENGTCLGCPFIPPGPTFGVGETISIDFTSETTAFLTWAGRRIPVERQDFFLSRTADIDPKTELWLGEWQAVLDLTATGTEFSESFPFIGDVMVFDRVLSDNSGDEFDGCRPDDAEIGLCADNPANPAFGFYSAGSDTNIVIVYDNSGESASDPNDDQYLVYEVFVGLTQFDGYAKVCFEDELDDVFNLCLDNDSVPAIGIRGWRSASRAFVQGDDAAPSAIDASPKVAAAFAEPSVRASLRSRIDTQTETAQAQRVASQRNDAAALQQRVNQGRTRLRERLASR